MTTTSAPDDLEAVRAVVAALQPFQAGDQERIIRWAREKLGLTKPFGDLGVGTGALSPGTAVAPPQSSDIKSFVAAKNPQFEQQFAVVVAYFYRFESTANERKDEITAGDLQEAARKAGRSRLNRPIDTLHNCVKAGLLDKGSARGAFSINTVGENLVAMALPEGQASATAPQRRSKKKAPKTKATAKRRR